MSRTRTSLSVDLLNRFLEMLRPMHGKLGPIMLQFEYLNKQKMPSMAVFLERLHAFLQKAPAGFQYALETRNPNYLKKEFSDSLRRGQCPLDHPAVAGHSAEGVNRDHTWLVRPALIAGGFIAWTGQSYRPTRDLDLLGIGGSSHEAPLRIIGEIVPTQVKPEDLE